MRAPALAAPPAESAPAYDAFISYSQRADIDLAGRVQTGLQRLAKPWWRMPLLRVFRDRTSLAASPGVWSSIEQNLARCRWFVLLASPAAAQSEWVGKEVRWWIEHRRIEQLLLVVTDGELLWDNARCDFDTQRTNCLPSPLAGVFREEPNFVDLRWARSRDELNLRHPRFRAAILDLAAPVHGRPKDQLDSDDIRQQRRTRTASAAAAATIAALAVGAAYAAWVATRNAETARRNETIALSRQSAAEAQLAIREGRLQQAFEAALTAWSTSPTQEARGALFEAWQAARPVQHWITGFDPIEALNWSPDSRRLRVWQRTGRLSEWSLAEGRVVKEARLALAAPPTASAFSTDGQQLAVGDARGNVTVFDTGSGLPVARLTAPQPNRVLSLAFHPARPWLAVGHQLDPDGLVLWDIARQTLAPSQPAVHAVDFDVAFITDLSFSADGRLLAAASGMPGSSSGLWLTGSGALLEKVSSSGGSVMHSALALLEDDIGGTGNARTRVALGWSNGETSLHPLAGTAALNSRHPRHEERVTRLVPMRMGMASTGDDGLVNITFGSGDDSTHRWPGWSRAPNRALVVDPQQDRVAAGGSDGTLIVYGLHAQPMDPARPVVQRVTGGRLLISQTTPPLVWLADGHTGTPLGAPAQGRRLVGDHDPWCAVLGADGRLALLDLREDSPRWKAVTLPAGLQPQAVDIRGHTVLVHAGSRTGPAVARLDLPQAAAQLLPAPWPVISAGLGPNGATVLARRGPDLALIDATRLVPAGEVLHLPPLPDDDDRYAFRWSADGRALLAGVAGKPALLLRRDAEGRWLAEGGADHEEAAFSADGRWLLSRRTAGKVWQLTDLDGGTPVWTHAADRLAAVHLVAATGAVAMLDTQGRLLMRMPGGHGKPPDAVPLEVPVRADAGASVALASSRDGRWVLASGAAGTAVLDTADRQSTWMLPGWGRPLAIAADAPRIALSSQTDRTIQVVDPRQRTRHLLQPALAAPPDSLTLTADGALLAALDKEDTRTVWDALNGRRIGPPERQADPAQPMSPQMWIDSLCERLLTADGIRVPAPGHAAEPPSRSALETACRAGHVARSTSPR